MAWTLEDMGHEVVRLQESEMDWPNLPVLIAAQWVDLMLWTRTAGFDPPDQEAQARAVKEIEVPTVFFHLDRWFGLRRETTERGPRSPDPSPCFSLDYLFTADGGHDTEWKSIGANHYWSPPAIAKRNLGRGRFRRHLWAEVGFVGNLRRYGHEEWAPYRQELYRQLSRLRRFRVWEGGVRGQMLADVYASVDVLIGDSCLAPNKSGEPMTAYHSDRIPETLGRGGFLIHPHVEGVTPELYPAEVLPTYELGNFDQLLGMVSHFVSNPEEAREIGETAMWFVETEHTYHHRLERVFEVLREDGAI